jgi:outer membrane protein insertion porin family
VISISRTAIFTLGILLSATHVLAAPPATKTSANSSGSSAKKSRKKGTVPYIPPATRMSDDVGAGLLGRSVSGLEVQGLKRIEKDAVLAKLSTKLGTELTRDQVRSDIQALFAMGFFDDIEVSGDDAGEGRVNVVYRLRERPVISKIEFEGNERISTTDLAEVTKIKEWSILDINKVKEDSALIQRHYEEKGFYLAKVSFEVRAVKDDEVQLVYKINDYEKVQIKKITFLNNKKFNDEQLHGVFQETREGGLFSFMSGSGNFKETSFKTDLQRLTLWYLDHGYVKFKYENPVVTVSDDKKYLFISIYMDEGEQYSMGPIDFGGDLLFPKEELGAAIDLKQGETFSLSRRNADIQRLTEKYQDLGYAFVNVVPKMNVNDETRLVSIEYDFEKGNLVHFGEINMLGNTKTHDKVIRRELKIHEGELYSGSNMRISKENVERLGYFAPGEVIFNTVTPKGKPDILNVEISVKERSTGTITLGAGYGSVQGFFLTTTISEINLFGRGQTVSLSGQYSTDRSSQSFNLGFTEPYTLDTTWSTGFDIYYVTFPIPRKYQTRKLGFDFRFGHPIFEYTNAYITYKNEGLRITDIKDILTPQSEIDADNGILSSVVWSVVRDKRNNRFETTEGNYQSVSLETAGLGGDKEFIKAIANNRFYKRVVGDLVFRNNLEIGKVGTLGEKPIPPSERFYLGGPNNMKGYDIFLLGPTRQGADANTIFTVPTGGTVEAFTSFELEHPILKEVGLKWVVFADVGNNWESIPNFGDKFVVRADWGFGVRWFSPIGPLRFEWGFPFAKKPGESSTVFNFFIGPPF